MYSFSKRSWIKHLDFIALDLCSILGIYAFLGYRLGVLQFKGSNLYFRCLFYIALISIVYSFLSGCYSNILHRGYMVDACHAVAHISVICVTLLVALYFIKEAGQFSRFYMILFWALETIVMTVTRTVYKKLLIAWKKNVSALPKIALVSDMPITEETIRAVQAARLKCRLMAVFADTFNSDDLSFERHLRTYGEYEFYRNRHPLDSVVLDIRDYRIRREWMDYLTRSGMTVHIRVDPMYQDLPHVRVESIGKMTVITSSPSIYTREAMFIKRGMDIAGGLVGLIITGITALIIGPIICKQSGASAFYSQERIGKNGRIFKMYKFRSMYADADARKAELMSQNKMNGFMFKVDKDPRIIPIGHFIRKHSIDELPQFWNVLKGDMSLVGTRPPTLDEWQQYNPHHRARLGMKPGLTGMWQVSGRSDITNFEEVVEMDRKYIAHWSILLDIKIIFQTIIVIFRGTGAS